MTRALPAAPDLSRAVHNDALMTAALAMVDNRLHDAEPLLRAHLKRDPFDVAAIRMMAELAGRIGRYPDAETLLRRAIELAPGFLAARSNLATVLYRQGRAVDAIVELDLLIANDPGNAAHANLKAAASGRIGDYAEAIALYETVLKTAPTQEKIWMSYGHVLKTVGRLTDSVAAYRKAVVLRPSFGEVWWSLANLKTVIFCDDDIAVMQGQLATPLRDEDRFHIDFAIATAFEARGDWATAFAHYEAANRLRAVSAPHDSAANRARVTRSAALFDDAFFHDRAGRGHNASDPIFIVGMPRAGSTLIEQILSSHSAIEGTQELPDIGMMASRIAQNGGLDAVAALSVEQCAALGEEYLARTRINRKTGKPRFIDKMPNNWQHLALIHMILPNAKIIDARRHPLDCCFSNYRQHFARGQAFAYSLSSVGEYYCDYVDALTAFDRVLPGRIHRVIHESLVDDTQAEVRALLAYLEVPFEPACLRFWENDRAVQTPSAEQVRRPINKEGVGRWEPYDEWLGPLREALGPVLGAYPAAPA